MSKKNKLTPGTKNAFFNTDEEAILREHFENREVNQFHSLILEKLYENYPATERDVWERLMDILEKIADSQGLRDQIALYPEEDIAINMANLLYLTLTTPFPSF